MEERRAGNGCETEVSEAEVERGLDLDGALPRKRMRR